MSDNLISKQTAYEVLSEYYNHKTEMQHKALREALDRVPSAEPERKKARWKGDGLGDYRCSLCGEVTRYFRTNYCPNCGAYMWGGEDDV